MKETTANVIYPYRRVLILTVFVLVSAVLVWRGYYLQIMNRNFLQKEGDERALRVVEIPAHRGIITDRNNEPLAISTPVNSIWANPREVLARPEALPVLAAKLGMQTAELESYLRDRSRREFVYLKRHVSPDFAREIGRLEIVGVYQQQEFRRYYPAAEVTAHLVGVTNIDDNGQEGVELAYDHWLKGEPGQKRVLKDRLGRVIRDVESIRPADPGKTLALSIDRRVQYLAYRELSAAVEQNQARGGSLVMLDAKTGEVLALAVQPSYNPNSRTGFKTDQMRNRAVVDIFEPGSTLKPFTIAAGLMSGLFDTDTVIDTSPGQLKVSSHIIHDVNNYGRLDLAGIMQKSSNVGASRIGLAIGPEPLWQILREAGFGETTGSGYPGESPGMLANYRNWRELDLAAVSFGHGLAVTALQLAQAYTTIANEGVLIPVSILRIDPAQVTGRRVMPADIAAHVKIMLEKVVEPGGTGQKASVPLYRVMGKTGTAHKSSSQGYAEDKYMSLFAGIAPSNDPRLVLVVVIDEPRGSEHYGGLVAAPVFGRVVKGALRILNIPPDHIPEGAAMNLLAAAPASTTRGHGQ